MITTARLLLAALLAVAVAASRDLLDEDGVTAAISGGFTPEQNRYRWMTSLRYSTGPYKGEPLCGAVLIAPTVMLTAASCTLPQWGMPRAATLFPWARIGVNTRRGGEYEIRFITGVLLHAGWNRTTNPALNDIALLRLGGGKIPSVPSLMTPIRLPPKKPNPLLPLSTQLSALGFGDWGKPNVPIFIQQAKLALQPQSACRKEWPQFGKVWTTNKSLCAGTKGQAPGICSGDYGGPLFRAGRTVAQDMLLGIGAFNGRGCGKGGLSGFTNVAQYRGWIDFGVKILENEVPANALYKAYYNQNVPTPL
ncbi:Kallikrein 1-related peptidase b26 [Chlorella vulgaris]